MNENEHLKSNNVDVLSQYDMKEPPEKADSPVDNEYESLNAESPFLIQKRNSIGGRNTVPAHHRLFVCCSR